MMQDCAFHPVTSLSVSRSSKVWLASKAHSRHELEAGRDDRLECHVCQHAPLHVDNWRHLSQLHLALAA